MIKIDKNLKNEFKGKSVLITDVVRHPLVSKIVKAYSDKNSD